MRVAVTGAGGRLGSALVAALADAPFTGPAGPIAWRRDAFDLDAPDGIGARLDRDRPEVVVHAAAWTDVDGCALDPELAIRRNGTATGVLAAACAERGIDLLIVSTNEVFERGVDATAGRGSRPTRPSPATRTAPRSSRASGSPPRRSTSGPAPRSGSPGRRGCSGRPGATSRAGSSTPPSVPGPPASRCAPSATSGARRPTPPTSPTRSSSCSPRTRSAGSTTSSTGCSRRGRTGPATSSRRAGIDVEVVNVPMSTWERPSRPPRWGVLAATPLPSGEPLRVWPDAMADYAPRLLRAGAGRAREREPSAVVAARRPLRRDRPACRQRGSFRELWRAGDFPDEPFVQANLSTSAAGVLRGLHLHRRQDDLWIVADGRAFVALVDVRPMLDGSGQRPAHRDARAARRRVGRHPDRGRPRLPRARAAPAHLPRDQRVRRLRRARLRLGRPGRRGRLAAARGDPGRAPDPVRA